MPRQPTTKKRSASSGTQHAEPWRWFVVLGFGTVMMVLALGKALPRFAPPIYLVSSMVALVLYGIDKAAAKKGRWRIPESTLLVTGLVGGWPGALIAQGTFRHKSAKRAFLVKFWLTVVVNCAVLAWACMQV